MPYTIEHSTPGIHYTQKVHLTQRSAFGEGGFPQFCNNPLNEYRPQKSFRVYYYFIYFRHLILIQSGNLEE